MSEPENLPVPRTEAGRAGLDAVRAAPGRALVALDYDGTLSPIVPDPRRAFPADGALDVLRRLAGAVGTLAIVTGRPAAEVVELGGLDAVPGLLVAGQYGAERWQDGTLELPDPPPGVATVRDALPGLLAQLGADPGVWVEDKRLALAVHTRRAADPDGALAALDAPLRRVAEDNGLEPHPGRLVLELRPPGFDKGAALRRLVEAAAPAAVLFGGDDVGDLPAFALVEALRANGLPGVTVAAASAEATAVAARADLAVDGPAGMVALLGSLVPA
jgi:trehalose 6-phosphate phosphatase